MWEQAFQKATVENERMKQDEQRLNERRQLLRMLVDAATEQCYRTEEDCRRMRIEMPLVVEVKTHESGLVGFERMSRM